MSMEERILFSVAIASSVLILGVTVHNGTVWNARQTRIEASIKRLDTTIEEQQIKNSVRDRWMVAHQNEIMKRIEKRTEK